LVAVAGVLRAIAEVGHSGGALLRLRTDITRNQLRAADLALRDPQIRWDVFPGMPETAGAGAAVSLLATLADGRRVSWTVEVWIDTWEAGGEWSAVVKGDVDRDLTSEALSDEECLFLEQETFHDLDGIELAVREMADRVVAQPVG
jgi:hypothetical protein